MTSFVRAFAMVLLAGAACVSPAGVSVAQTGAPPAPARAAPPSGAPVSTVPPAIQQLRRAMLSADVNTLTFRSMDTLFDTRQVTRSGPVWNLPREDHALDFTYQFEGKALDTDGFFDRTFTNALLIIKNGKIVYEGYRNRSGPDTRFMSWSMAKSITSTLVGLALHDKYIKSLDDDITVYLPELKGSGYEGASIRDILEMRSGVDYEERYDFDNPGVAARNHEAALVRNVARFADVARTLKRIHKPGSFFQYKTIDTAVLGWLVERVTKMPAARYMTTKIWEPMGAEANGFFIMDGPPGVGREFTGAGFNATLRDYGRFGQMILNQGFANGQQLVPARWIREATAPARGEEGERGGYGYQWWTAASSDAFFALGLQGQHIYIDPPSQTVIVKLSYFPPAEQKARFETLAFMAAAAAWKP